MAKKQTRRTISINRALFERVKLHAETTGTPMSQLTEGALRRAIESGPQPRPADNTSFMADLVKLKQKWGIA